MNIGLFQHLKQGWKVYLDDKASLLKIYDGRRYPYFAAFGPKPSPFSALSYKETLFQVGLQSS